MSDDDFGTWLRRRIKERAYLAHHAIELGNAETWTELSSGVLMTIAPDAPQDNWDGVWAMGDSSLTRLMEANDPRDTIARCDAELAILDAYASAAKRREQEHADYGAWVRGEASGDRPQFTGPSPSLIPGLELAVRHVASAYRDRPGYREEWKP